VAPVSTCCCTCMPGNLYQFPAMNQLGYKFFYPGTSGRLWHLQRSPVDSPANGYALRAKNSSVQTENSLFDYQVSRIFLRGQGNSAAALSAIITIKNQHLQTDWSSWPFIPPWNPRRHPTFYRPTLDCHLSMRPPTKVLSHDDTGFELREITLLAYPLCAGKHVSLETSPLVEARDLFT
jgi:hypothetical protein